MKALNVNCLEAKERHIRVHGCLIRDSSTWSSVSIREAVCRNNLPLNNSDNYDNDDDDRQRWC